MNIDITNKDTIINSSILKLPSKGYREILGKNVPYKIVKRTVDTTIAGIGVILLVPLFLIIALAIKLETKGPVFFKHTRIGKNGKIIKIYKFRTMVENAEELMKNFTEEQKKQYKKNYKLANDPRITKVGKLLRKLSLDELPQLINILKGEMSLIGPRPVVSEELKKYGTNTEKFLSVKPGLTGFWAANGRSCTSYEQRMQMELFYIDNLSLKMDIKVFFKTIEAVVNRRGAI